jgi:hypothetical protein
LLDSFLLGFAIVPDRHNAGALHAHGEILVLAAARIADIGLS